MEAMEANGLAKSGARQTTAIDLCPPESNNDHGRPLEDTQGRSGGAVKDEVCVIGPALPLTGPCDPPQERFWTTRGPSQQLGPAGPPPPPSGTQNGGFQVRGGAASALATFGWSAGADATDRPSEGRGQGHSQGRAAGFPPPPWDRLHKHTPQSQAGGWSCSRTGARRRDDPAERLPGLMEPLM